MEVNKDMFYTIEEFCKMHNFSKPTYHQLRKLNKIPKYIKLPRKVLIKGSSILEWRDAMENKTL